MRYGTLAGGKVLSEVVCTAGPRQQLESPAFAPDGHSQTAGLSSSHKRNSAAVRSLLPVTSLPQQPQEQVHHPWAPSQLVATPAAAAAAGACCTFLAKQSSHRRPLFAPASPALPLYHSNTSTNRSSGTCRDCWNVLLSPSSSSSNCWPAGTPATGSSWSCTHSYHSRLRSMVAPVAGSAAAGEAVTLRALAAGLLVGSVLCFSNMYFGLQTGWVTMGSLQSAILGYGLFQGLGALGLLTQQLTVAENVIVQTTAVATATMPLAAGLVGIIPALGLLTPDEHPGGPILLSSWQLLAWCASLAFFGVFVAVPLRQQTIIREKLRFPSGTATASVIRTLHGVPEPAAAAPAPAAAAAAAAGGVSGVGCAGGAAGSRSNSSSPTDFEGTAEGALLLAGHAPSTAAAQADVQLARQQQWRRGLRLLLWCFAVSGLYCLAAAWVKPLSVLPIFDWLGWPAATAWGWVLQPSPGYIGQGMIMGPKTAWSMMAGAVVGWGVLGPNAKARGWAPGPIKDAESGAAGWLLWVALGLLLGDCFSELGLLLLQTAVDKAGKSSLVQRVGSSWGSGFRGRSRGGAGVRRGGKGIGFRGSWGDDEHRGVGGRGAESAAADWVRLGTADPEQGFSSEGLGAYTSSSSGTAAARNAALEMSPTGSANGLADAGADPSDVTNSRQHVQRSGGSAGGAADSTAAEQSADVGKHRDSGGWMLSVKFWLPGLMLSTGLCSVILGPLLPLGMPLHEPLIAVVVALLVALLAVRALGQTDLNPVSGVGKISQLVFAVVSPGAVVPNLVAGAIAEAGAQQAGDLMQDFKTAHLLGVPPSSQLLAMLLGSAASVPLSVAAYKLYTAAWQVPGPELPAPMALIWLNMAKLVNGGKLPDHVGPFCAGAAVIAAALPVLQHLLRRHAKGQAVDNAQEQQQVDDGDGDESLLVPSGYYPDARKYSDDGSAAGFAAAAADVKRLPVSVQLNAHHQQQQQQQQQQPQHAWRGRKQSTAFSSIRACFSQAWLRLLSTWRARSAVDWVLALLPSGVGFAVGMYLTANWTLPRVLGSIVDQCWLLLSPGSHAAFMMVTASGLVLGEGCASVVTAVLHAVLG